MLSRNLETLLRSWSPVRQVMSWRVTDHNQASTRSSGSSTPRGTRANITDFLEIEKRDLRTNICLYLKGVSKVNTAALDTLHRN
jgi:hypothetical protein